MTKPRSRQREARPVTVVAGALVGLAMLAACREGGDDGPGQGSSGAEGGSSTPGMCPLGYRPWSLPGVREDVDRACVDVTAESILFFDVCRPLDESEYHPLSFYYCMRRVADGERYWVNPIFWLVLPMPGEWELCDESPDLEELPPYPCFTDACEHSTGHPAPRSTCAEGAIRAMYGCGGHESMWDENCCRRPFCGPNGECPDGLECREVEDVSPRGDCWVGLGPDADPATADLNDASSACSCTGAFADGPLPRVCIEPR